MDDDASVVNNPWLTLSTVTTFDRGDKTRTTRCVDNNDEVQNNGQVVKCVAPSGTLLIISLIQQLCTMFEGDTIRRNKLYFAICDRLHELKLIDSSYNLMELEVVRGQYQRALYHLVEMARATTGSENPLHVPSSLMAEWSRYRREFQEISFIARGGFGDVFKVLHRLDGIEYAVKRIIVRSGRVNSIVKHLGEVKTLAKLNHTNIVSYKSAWIEQTLPSMLAPRSSTTQYMQTKQHTFKCTRISHLESSHAIQNFNTQNQLNSDSYINNRSNKQDISFANMESYKTGMYINSQVTHQKSLHRSTCGFMISREIINERFQELNTSTNIIGKRIVEENDTKDIEKSISDIVSFRSDSKSSKSNNHTENNSNYTGASDSYDESVNSNKLCPYNSQMNQDFIILYIQMALCEKTLQEWLNERNNSISHQTINAIFTQILRGLDYIHSQGIVHHDIKPSNIFISTSGHLQIQLGDFGLACPLQRESHNYALGTHLYAAPEQLQGKCNPKSDIYSVGIVLLELLIPTETQMELVSIINDLKSGQIPRNLTTEYPTWAHMLSQLIQEDLNKRPSTADLLQSLKEDKDLTIAQLKNVIDEKDNEIQELREAISVLQKQMTTIDHQQVRKT